MTERRTTAAPAPAPPATPGAPVAGRPPGVPRGGRSPGVRARTTAAATLVVALAFAVGAVALVLALGASLRGAAESSAESRAEEIADVIERGGPEALATDDSGDSGDSGEDEDDVADLAWQVTRGDSLVAASGTGGLTVPRRDGRAELDEDPYVVVTETADAPDGTEHVVAVAVSLEEADDSVAALWPLLAVGIPLAVLVVAATTWVAAGRALRPVEAIRTRVAGIGAEALDQRVPVPSSRDEVARLAVTMNAMLERLESSSRRQQQFVSDTSHELRSPLASLRQTAEVARAHPDALEDGELTEAVLEETARMQHLVEQMLVLTRTQEGAAQRRRSEVDLDDLLLTEARRVRRERPDLVVDTSGVAPGRAFGDEPALAQVVRNLVDNAVRHTRTRLDLTCGPGPDGDLLVGVADDGAGVAPADRDRVFERFVRLDEARSRDAGGSGLGLAIVREIARSHGGDAWVVDRAAGGGEVPVDGGAQFVVRLPAGG